MQWKIFKKHQSFRRALLWCGALVFIGGLLQVNPGKRISVLPPARADVNQPNIVVIRTDDEDVTEMHIHRPDTGALVMQEVHDLIANNGITFQNNFVSYSLCCPSRAAFYSGQYAHNNHVLGNTPPFGGYQRFDHTNTLPVWLQNAGYDTVHIGKYMNGYNGNHDGIPPGWDEWYTTWSGNYYGYQLNENGTIVSYGYTPADYSTDVFTRKAVQFIRRADSTKPFYLMLDYNAPHWGGAGEGAPIPAPRHQGIFDNYEPQWPPNFNERDVSDKPAWIRALPRFSTTTIAAITTEYRQRLGTLLAVDEGVARIVHALADAQVLENTYIFFTSDNGYEEGEHRIPSGKGVHYEESIRVPLVVRIPGMSVGKEAQEIVANIDFAPTFVELAHATALRVMDGRSFLPLLRGEGVPWNRDLFLDSYSYTILSHTVNRGAIGLRNKNYAYIESDSNHDGVPDERELYNFTPDSCRSVVDPYELDSQQANPCYQQLLERLHNRVQILQSCSGASCQ